MDTLFIKLLAMTTLIVAQPLITAPIPQELEPIYAEAVLTYGDSKDNEALKFVEQGLAEEPKQIKFLEMKALILKNQNRSADALDIYRKIVRLEKGTGKTKKELAPYLFEIGVLQYQNQKRVEAQANLESALEFNFNPAAAHLFLGLIQVGRKNWDDARAHFENVIDSNILALKPLAYLQLAQLSSQMSDAAGAVRNYSQAGEAAKGLFSDESVHEQTRLLAEHAINLANINVRAFSKNIFLSSVGLVSGYDSNVLSIPTDTADAGSKPGSFKQSLLYSMSYATAPLSRWQIASSYRGNMNYNFNQDTKSGQYFNHSVSLFLTRDPIALTNYGFKIEGFGALQFQGKFAPYNLGGAFGPYGKIHLGSRWVFGANVFFSPQKFYLDTQASEELQKSGWDQTVRFFVTREEPRKFFNPVANVTLGYSRSGGREYRSRKVGIDFANSFNLTDQFITALTGSYAHTAYTERSDGTRLDDFFAVGTAALYRASPSISLFTDAQFSQALTNVAAYRYKRVMGSVGMNYVF